MGEAGVLQRVASAPGVSSRGSRVVGSWEVPPRAPLVGSHAPVKTRSGGAGQSSQRPSRRRVRPGGSSASRRAWRRRGVMRNQRYGVARVRGSEPVRAANRSPRSRDSASISRTSTSPSITVTSRVGPRAVRPGRRRFPARPGGLPPRIVRAGHARSRGRGRDRPGLRRARSPWSQPLPTGVPSASVPTTESTTECGTESLTECGTERGAEGLTECGTERGTGGAARGPGRWAGMPRVRNSHASGVLVRSHPPPLTGARHRLLS